jgi:hypothetical protein
MLPKLSRDVRSKPATLVLLVPLSSAMLCHNPAPNGDPSIALAGDRIPVQPFGQSPKDNARTLMPFSVNSSCGLRPAAEARVIHTRQEHGLCSRVTAEVPNDASDVEVTRLFDLWRRRCSTQDTRARTCQGSPIIGVPDATERCDSVPGTSLEVVGRYRGSHNTN